MLSNELERERDHCVSLLQYTACTATLEPTSSLVKNTFAVDNLRCNTVGRAIVFDLDGLSLGNFYGHSGTDGISRASRENFYAEVVPQLLTSRRQRGCVGGDWNCIVDKADATVNPENKMSNCPKRVIQTFELKDSFRMQD